MKWIKKWGWVILLVILAVVFYAYREYTRKPADLDDVTAQAAVEAAALVTAYDQDEQKANSLYLGKAIDVSGVVSEVANQSDTSINIMLGNKADMHRVSCLMNPAHAKEARSIKAGDRLTIRGICTGYLLDVELNRCVLIQTSTK